jgi:hypothetical protein
MHEGTTQAVCEAVMHKAVNVRWWREWRTSEVIREIGRQMLLVRYYIDR